MGRWGGKSAVNLGKSWRGLSPGAGGLDGRKKICFIKGLLAGDLGVVAPSGAYIL